MIIKALCYLSGVPAAKAEAIKEEIKATPAAYKWAFAGLLIGPFMAIHGLARAEAPPWTMALVTLVQVGGFAALILTNLTRKGIKW